MHRVCVAREHRSSFAMRQEASAHSWTFMTSLFDNNCSAHITAGQECHPQITPQRPMISLHQVSKTYETPAGKFAALKDIDLEIRPGQFVGIVGKSGSGKSTLLNMVAGIDRPSAGSVAVAGTEIQSLSENKLAAWRGRNVGFVFQFFQLLPTLTAAENVMLPMDFCGTVAPRQRSQTALELLDRFGVAPQADKLPAALFGGEQQRVAIARALANDPPVVLAHEPTGNL